MDLIDKKILCELDLNCRMPLTQLAKKLRVGRNVVTYRIKNLENSGVITDYICSVNLGSLGYKTYKIYLNIDPSKSNDEKNFVEHCKKSREVIHFLKTEGEFDYSVTIAVKNISELDTFLSGLKDSFNEFIRDYIINIVVYSRIFKLHKLLLGQSSGLLKFDKYSGEEIEVRIDETDKKIIQQLSQHANLSIVELSEKTKLSIDIIKYRMKKLEKTIINSYRVISDLSSLGYHHYVVMLKIKRATRKDEERIISWCASSKNVIYCTKRIGPYDFEINAAIKDISELNLFLTNLKKEFQQIMDSYKVLINLKKIKLNYVPL